MLYLMTICIVLIVESTNKIILNSINIDAGISRISTIHQLNKGKVFDLNRAAGLVLCLSGVADTNSC